MATKEYLHTDGRNKYIKNEMCLLRDLNEMDDFHFINSKVIWRVVRYTKCANNYFNTMFIEGEKQSREIMLNNYKIFTSKKKLLEGDAKVQKITWIP